jgi:ADP-L-glycero-D-manno-heptose 6-epimerase
MKKKEKTWEHKKFIKIIERYNFFDWLDNEKPSISCIIHLGARTDTTEFNYEVHRELNFNYSVLIWKYCVANNIPLIYASSAATYGNGNFGYEDNHSIIEKLQPLNPYGISKNEFDKWAVKQKNQPPYWTGLKFFNVYGPNEYHKKKNGKCYMAFISNQIKNDRVVNLFKSHHPQFEDGEQLRDFIYVKDVVKVIYVDVSKYDKPSMEKC